MNLFALLASDTAPVVTRVPIDSALQGELGALFDAQEDAMFADDPELHPFTSSYFPDRSELAYIDEFELPQVVAQALKAPLEQDLLDITTDGVQRIKGFFGSKNGAAASVRFQAFDKRRLLDASGFSIVLSKSTFRRLVDPGLTLDTSLAALWRDGRLYFPSFFTARRVLDLAQYYRQATEQDLLSLASQPGVVVNTAQLQSNADEWVRRHIALILDSEVLKRVKVRTIVNEAVKFGLTIDTKKVKGKDSIVFPDDKKELKQLLRFLDQDVYAAPLTGDKFVANSKRPL